MQQSRQCRALPAQGITILVLLLLASIPFLPDCGRSQIPVRPNPVIQNPVTITADSEIGVGNQQQLVGHVQFAQGSLTGSSDRATRYLDQNKIDLDGHVIIRQDTLFLMAPHVTWEAGARLGHADGNVMLMDRDVVLTATSGDYDANNQIAYFYKHVTITQDKTTSVSDSMTYYRATETSDSRGDVTAQSDSGSLRADRVIHSKALDETTAIGNVEVQNDSLRITSDWLYDAKPRGILFARGKVMVHSLADNTIIYGDTLARFAATPMTGGQSRMSVPISPLLLMIDSSRTKDSMQHDITRFDTLFVKSRTMEAWQGDSTRYIATDSVRLMRSDFRAIGGKLDYNQKAGLMTLSQAKRIHLWNDSTEVDADSLAMLLDGRKLRQVNAVGHAFTTSPVAELPNSGRIDQLQGELMEMYIRQDSLRDILDVSNALSIYFLVDGLKPNGLNRASGDTIRIDFEKKQVRRVTVISGTEGEYFPERFVKNRAQAYRLAGFERNTSLRPKRIEFTEPWLNPANIPAPAVDALPTTKAKKQMTKRKIKPR